MTSLLLSALAALCLGTAVAAQQRAAHEVAPRAPGRPGLLLDLARRPWWLAGTAASVLASLAQIGALATGPVIVVQCVLMAGLPAAAVVESVLARRWPSRRVAAGTLAGTVGPVALVLLLAPVRPGDPGPVPVGAAVGVVGVVALVAGSGLLLARRRPGPAGAPGLGLACGAGYGLTASLLAVVVHRGLEDVTALPAEPALYGVLLVGPASFVVSQHALQRARRSAPVLVPILVVDPLVAGLTGVAWLSERVRVDPLTVAAALVALATTTLGLRWTAERDDARPVPGVGR